jgi:hypothetical protein
MRLATRIFLLVVLILPIRSALAAQEAPPGNGPSTATPAAGETPASAASEEKRSIQSIRQEFSEMLRLNPPQLATVLALDPNLLSNQEFLAAYPELDRFVAAHPEIRKNPRFYLSEFQVSGRGLDDVLEPLIVLFSFVFIAFALGWLVRTLIEQKRWSWLSRTQNEVHGKILDRLGSSAELLEYIKTPVGTRFLEAAPIPLHTDQPAHHPPLARALWSIQIGVVVAAAAIGLLIVSARFDGETGQGLFAMGVITFFIGAGFIASAGVSLFLSRRLGIWQPSRSPEVTSAERFDDPGLVR